MKRIKLKDLELVEISWDDHMHTSGFQWLNDLNWERIEKQSAHLSAGYVVRNTPITLSISQSKRVQIIDGDHCVDEIQHLLWKNITDVRKLNSLQ